MNRREALRATGIVILGGAAGCGSEVGDAALHRSNDSDNGGGTTPSPLVLEVPQTTIPILGEDAHFPVRRIYCIGRNYAAHAIEMGSDPTREPPFFFQKATDSIQVAHPGQELEHPFPPLTRDYHHEIELVVAMKGGGRNISPDEAVELVYGYAVGLDMTRRDLQQAMREEGKPWEVGKSFDNAAVLGPLQRAEEVGHLQAGTIRLSVNGEVRQEADLSDMIWNVAEQIQQLSRSSELRPGDIIYSGTPENVGPVMPGDVMFGEIDGLEPISVRVGPPTHPST